MRAIGGRPQTSSSFSRRVLLMFGGTAASQTVTLIATPVLLHLYAPAQFGVYAVAMAVIAIIGVTACLRYDVAIALPRGQRQAVSLLGLCAVVACSVTILSALAIALAAQHVPKLSLAPPLLLAMVPIGIWLTGMLAALRCWAIRRNDFRSLSFATLLQAIATVSVQFAAALIVPNSATALMTGTIVGLSLGLAYLARSLPSFAHMSSALTLRRFVVMARHYANFPLYRAPFSVVGQIGDRALVLVISALVSTFEAGLVAVATRVVFLPLSLISGAMEQVLYGEATQGADRKALEALIRRALFCEALFFGPLFAIGAFHMPMFFASIFGAAWFAAGRSAAFLGVAALSMLLTDWLVRLFDVSGRQNLLLILEICYVGICFPAVALILHFGGDVVVAIAAFASFRVVHSLVRTAFGFSVVHFSLRTIFQLTLTLMAVFAVLYLVDLASREIGASEVATVVIDLAAATPLLVFAARRWSLQHTL